MTDVRQATIAGAYAIAVMSICSVNPVWAQPAEPSGPWSGSGGVGLSLTRGNSDTANYNLALDLTHDPQTRNVMKWTALYLRGKQDDTLTVNRTSLGFRDEFTLSGRTFVFGQIDYLRDTFKLIDYLIAPTGGIGFKVLDAEPTKFAVHGGAGGVWERNTGFEVSSGGALTAGETLEHQLSSTASIKHAITGLWRAGELGDALYNFSVGLATRVTERIQLSVDLLDTYKTRPPTVETKKNDVALVTAVTAKF
jgi:putative salt-induced outer membrane protein